MVWLQQKKYLKKMIYCRLVIKISLETFDVITSKLQDELVDIIENNIEINDYQLIMYKYIFITELEIPLLEDNGIEIGDDSFILYIIPDDLDFDLLKKLDFAFDKFKLSFMANKLNVLKLRFRF